MTFKGRQIPIVQAAGGGDATAIMDIECGGASSSYSHDNSTANTDPIPEPDEVAADLAKLERQSDPRRGAPELIDMDGMQCADGPPTDLATPDLSHILCP